MKRLIWLLLLSFCGYAQQPLVVLIPSHNNAAWCIKNIESVIKQTYTNYRVIYIDDCSTDETFALIQKKVVESNCAERVTLIRNTVRCGALANIYRAVHQCDDNEIIMLLDGDDWLAHDRVFAMIAHAYTNRNVWMTYGQYQVYPDGKLGECKDIPRSIMAGNYYREYAWCTSHLRTFYAGLFKQIKLQDLLYKGNFFDVTWDKAILFPMLEMAAGRCMCIHDVVYIYNCATPYNDFKMKLLWQIHCDKVITSKAKYSPIASYTSSSRLSCAVTVLMMSHDNPPALKNFLESIKRYGSGFDCLHVLYTASDETVENAYARVKQQYPFAHYHAGTRSTCKHDLLTIMQQVTPYIVFSHDGMELVAPVTFDACAQLVAHTHALGLYMSLGKDSTHTRLLARAQQQPSLALVYDDVYAWHIAQGEYAWRTCFTLDMALYRSDAIAPLCAQCEYDSWQSLEHALCMAYVDPESIGLVFEQSKARNNG